MDQSAPLDQTEQKQADWMSNLQLVFSIAVFVCAMVVVLAGLFGDVFLPQGNLAQDLYLSTEAMLRVFAWSSISIAGVALVSIITSARKRAGKPLPSWTKAKMPWLYCVIAILPVLLLAGQSLFRVANIARAWMPIFSVVSIFLTGLWYMRVGVGRDWGKQPQRGSGLLTFSFGFTAVLILVTEIFVLVFFGLGFYALTLHDPEIQALYRSLPVLMQGLLSGTQAGNQMLEIVLQKPIIIASVLILIALLMPLVEELLKTFGVLLLKGRKLSPREGMLAGIFCAAGFGIFEGMLFTVQMGVSMNPGAWMIFVIGRSAALILHIFNGALNGFALVRYWNDHKFSSLLGVFLITLFIHGVWNLVAVLAEANILEQTASTGITILIFLIVFLSYMIFTRKAGSANQEMVFTNGT
jgi:hypothetical protein